MPVYDYRCAECSATYDIYHKVREVTEDVICPVCGSKSYKKLMSVPTVATHSHGDSPSSSCACDNGGECCGGGPCGMN